MASTLGRKRIGDSSLAKFKTTVEVDNRYGLPVLLGKTPAEAKDVQLNARAKPSEEECKVLREAGSKFLGAWVGAPAYPNMPEYCSSKNIEEPKDLTSFCRFMAEGHDGLRGYIRHLSEAEEAAQAQLRELLLNQHCATPEVIPGDFMREIALLKQQVATQQAQLVEKDKIVKTSTKQNAKLTKKADKLEEQLSVVKHRNKYYKRSNNTLMKNSKERRKLKRKLDRLMKANAEQKEIYGNPRLFRKDIDELKVGGKAWKGRIDCSKRHMFPSMARQHREARKQGTRRR